MTCITSEDRTTWQEDLDDTVALITAIRSAIRTSPLISGIQRIDFDSGTGRQTEVFRSPQEMFASLENLKATRDRLTRKLRGTDIIRSQTRRARGY